MSPEHKMRESIDKAKILVEALPYIQEFNGTTVVIKYGGSAMADGPVRDTVMQDIALMKFVGINPVVVHGGGPQIDQMLARLGVEPEFHGGLRVTDAATMEIVEMVLSGKVGKDIAARLQEQGVRAAAVSGRDGGLLRAKRVGDHSLGLVGQITGVDTALISSLIQHDFVPVISSIAAGANGTTYNINADHAAVAVAVALAAEKLVFMTDVPGILRDPADPASLISEVKAGELGALVKSGDITGGMIPKAECAVEATRAGVRNVHILDGRVEHCLLLEIFTRVGIGTMVQADAGHSKDEVSR